MDRMVNVRFYSVENVDGDATPFADCLHQIADRQLPDRESEVEPEIVIRLERHDIDGPNIVKGELVRIQSENLPPKAVRGEPVTRLGVPSIGHTAAFRYDTARSILAMETGRSGLTPYRLGMYVAELAGVPGYGVWPVITENAWQKLEDSRVRKMMVKVASPDRLAPVAAEHQMVKSALTQMKNAAHTTYVEAVFGMGHVTDDISNRRARSWFRWLLGERDNDNGAGVSKVNAEIRVDGADQNELLRFIDCHLGEKRKIDLPNDDPDVSYARRDAYIQAVMAQFRDEINAQF